MSNATKTEFNGMNMVPPNDATHFSEFYGYVTYWRKSEYQYPNSVEEAWQTRYKWSEWDRGAWRDPGTSFSTHRCLPIPSE